MADNTQDNNAKITLFGFEIKRKSKKEEDKNPPMSVVPPTDEDGAGYVTSAGSHYAHYIDLEGKNEVKDNVQLIQKYRTIAENSDVDMAIGEIVNEAIVTNDNERIVNLSMEELKMPESIKKKIADEFEEIYQLLNFSSLGPDIFKSWYIDGRIYHHIIVDAKNTKEGIKEIRHIDSTKIRKVKQVKKEKDLKTGATVVTGVDEFFLFEDKPGQQAGAIKMTNDSISYVTSGLLDSGKKRIISHLHKAIKPANQLAMMEDSLVIYRLARAPERRIFYIDVGNMPQGKAQQYMKDIMTRYRNKLVYDANTGELKDDRKHMSMMEDFWLPRREGGRGTEISTLPGGANLSDIDDILFFQKKMYRSLNVPVSRLEQETQFSLGRSSEITRDELKFQRFIDRLRNRFSTLFLGILKKQLLIKNIITEEDWNLIERDIFVDYQKDNHFTELKESELIRERASILGEISQFVPEYYTKDWVYRNVLRYTEEEIKDLEKFQKEAEKSGEFEEEPPPPPPPPAPIPVVQVDPEKEKPAAEKKPEDKQKKESFSYREIDVIDEETRQAELQLMNTIKDFISE